VRPHKSDPRRAANATGAGDDAGQAVRDDRTAGVSHDDFAPLALTVDLAEAAVLGAMVLHRPALEGAAATLTGADFARSAHRRVFDTLAAMLEAGVHVDHVTLTLRLADDGHTDEVGGLGAVFNLTDPLACPAPTAWAAYTQLVRREGRRRRGIAVLRRALVRLEAGADPAEIATELGVAA
jgi:replicative DNA helicase